MSDDKYPEFDVAVVVFCRARGGDMPDAEDRAKLAVRYALAGQLPPILPHDIPLPPVGQDVPDFPVTVVAAQGLRYTGGQGIALRPTAEPYRNAGLGKPRD